MFVYSQSWPIICRQPRSESPCMMASTSRSSPARAQSKLHRFGDGGSSPPADRALCRQIDQRRRSLRRQWPARRAQRPPTRPRSASGGLAIGRTPRPRTTRRARPARVDARGTRARRNAASPRLQSCRWISSSSTFAFLVCQQRGANFWPER